MLQILYFPNCGIIVHALLVLMSYWRQPRKWQSEEERQLRYIQGLNELKMNMDTITRLTFWEELFSTYVCELMSSHQRTHPEHWLNLLSISTLTSPSNTAKPSTQKRNLTHAKRNSIDSTTNHHYCRNSANSCVWTLSRLILNSLWTWTEHTLNGGKHHHEWGNSPLVLTSRGLVSSYLLWCFLLESKRCWW